MQRSSIITFITLLCCLNLTTAFADTVQNLKDSETIKAVPSSENTELLNTIKQNFSRLQLDVKICF